MKAILVVDMLNDFVTGSLKCERAQRIIPPLATLLEVARDSAWPIPVIYCNDAHIAGLDKEFKQWGEHAVVGSEGAKVIKELEPTAKDFIVPKRRYSGFFQTDLQLLLIELGITELIITGLHVNMCVRHTAADAFQWGYRIIVPSDGTEAFDELSYNDGITYLKAVYGATIVTVDEIVQSYFRI